MSNRISIQLEFLIISFIDPGPRKEEEIEGLEADQDQEIEMAMGGGIGQGFKRYFV